MFSRTDLKWTTQHPPEVKYISLSDRNTWSSLETILCARRMFWSNLYLTFG